MMKRSNQRIILCGTLIILTICLIWGNSLLNGDISGNISGGFSAWIGKIIPIFSPDSPNGHYLLRKCAHFSVFFLLGLELRWLFGMLCSSQIMVRCIAVAATVAAIDETIQRFIPDRHGCFSDVLIDLSGAVSGMLLLFLGYTFMQRKK